MNQGTPKPVPALLTGELLRSLKLRAKWPSVREYLGSKDLRPRTGWSAIDDALNGKKQAPELLAALQQYYAGINLAGDRYIQQYDLDDSAIVDLLKALASAQVARNAFHTHYPFILPAASLHAVGNQMELCEITQQGADYILVFCSRREYIERQLFEGSAAAAIGASTPSLAGFDRILGLKAKYFQAFDIVAIRPKLKRVEFQIDLPPGQAREGQKETQTRLLLQTATLCLPPLTFIGPLTRPVNMFPAIGEIYSDARNGGKLKSLKLRTATGLIDHLRTLVDGEDLRINKYHTNATEAVGNKVEPFEVLTELEFKNPGGKVTVAISSSVSMLASNDKFVGGFEVMGAATQTDILRATSKAMSFC
ncbi:hypothetical protein ACS5PN_16435 [Roseateles sp. NT4]|uniref:hypothetical protein n=1 Tax=Roseateles sp. NT4 TaxID=3453715 RepID=UPI003EEC17EC